MKDNLENKFKGLENQFDIEEPTIGHFNRFEAKLNQTNRNSRGSIVKLIAGLAIAASIVLFFGIWIGSEFSDKGMQLASVSTEMQETQSYFVSVIEKELRVVEKERNNVTEEIISDGLDQLKKLENQYSKLTLELKESNADKRVIYAMITNFQSRLLVLQNLMDQLEEFEELVPQENRV